MGCNVASPSPGRTKASLPKTLPVLGFAVIAALAAIAYAPGLSGGFLFDDFANLPALGAFGPVDNATTFWRYLTSGHADPTGRPLALLTFLIDARNWPADPEPFKRTNLILHLLNGCLLAFVLSHLGTCLRAPRAAFAAALGAGLWLLHPLFLSTTLYIVQREAMLPATCILLGMIGYLHGRERARTGRPWGVALAGVSIVTFTLLGVLAKASGALLPALVAVVEFAVLDTAVPLPRTDAGRRFRRAHLLLVVAPTLLLLGWLVFTGVRGVAFGIGAERPWTLGQRLLTEPRVLLDYLVLLWLPRPYSRGLFNDAYTASSGLLEPPTTLIALAVVAGVIGVAVHQRRHHPAAAAAALFFFAGHLMESTTIPLELYFEHRNYVAALPMFWPLALWLCAPPGSRAAQLEAPTLTLLRHGLTLVLPLLLAGLTYVGAELWGNTTEQALLWAARNPDSPRAQAYAAQIEVTRGHPRNAVARLRSALAANPDEIQIAFNLIDAECAAGTRPDIQAAARALRSARVLGRLAYDWLGERLVSLQRRPCSGVDLDAIETLVDAMAANEHAKTSGGRQQDVLNLQGRLALARGDGAATLQYFNSAFDADPTPSTALQQAAFLGSMGYPALGLQHLDYFAAARGRLRQPGFGMRWVHARLLEHQAYWDGEARRLRGILLADVHQGPTDAR